MRHWEEDGLMVFQIDPIKDQIKRGEDPYVVNAYTDGHEYVYFSFHHTNHGNVMECLPFDVSSIEVATGKVYKTLRQIGEELFPNRLPGILRRIPEG
jgi:hypothetical protein